jgi:hypothetical protein
LLIFNNKKLLKKSAAEFFEAIARNDFNKIVEILNKNKNIVNEKNKDTDVFFFCFFLVCST